jgi:hypothetical protein
MLDKLASVSSRSKSDKEGSTARLAEQLTGEHCLVCVTGERCLVCATDERCLVCVTGERCLLCVTGERCLVCALVRDVWYLAWLCCLCDFDFMSRLSSFDA